MKLISLQKHSLCIKSFVNKITHLFILLIFLFLSWTFLFFQDSFAITPIITNLKQYWVSWAQVTEISSWAWITNSTIRLEAFVTDTDNPANITEYFELIQTWSTFETWTSMLALSACNVSVSYNDCSSKIWEIQNTYTSWWTNYSVDIVWVNDSVEWYKWQTISYNWTKYSAWESNFDSGQFFKVDTIFYVNPIWWILDAAWAWDTTCYIKEWSISWEWSVWCVWRNNYWQLWDWTTIDSLDPVQVLWIDNAIQISLWLGRACAVLSDGKIKCWGYSAYWAIWNGTTWTFPTPVEVSWITNAVKVSTKGQASHGHSCAILSDTTVKCWGKGGHHQLWNWSTGNQYSPINVKDELWSGSLIWVVDITTTYLWTCAVINDWKVLCWGYDHYYQLWSQRIDNWAYRQYPSPVLNIWTTLSGAVAISSQHHYNFCARLSDGTWRCWWYWANWRLWNWANWSSYQSPTLISGLDNITSIEMWQWVWCASLTDWIVKCWWYNEHWQVWDWTYSERWSPVSNTSVSDIWKIIWWYNYMCAIKNDQTVSCWWENKFWQLANWVKSSYPKPESILGISSVSRLWTSQWEYHSCYVSAGEVYCFGKNDNGQLWDWTTISKYIPTKVIWITNAVSVEVSRHHTCSLLTDKTVKCWWYNGYWQLWNSTTANSTIPVGVSSLTWVTVLALWARSGCAVLEDWTSKCWWYWWYWNLWNNWSSNYSTPVSVYGISNAIDVSMDVYESYNHTCWVLADKTVKCSWANYNYQLWEAAPRTWWRWSIKVWDYNDVITQYLTWAKILPHNQWSNHSCVIKNDDSIWCWGYDWEWNLWTTENNLTDGTNKTSNYQQYKVQGITSASGIALAGHSTCALLPDKTVKCWGQNNYWQLWNWTTTNSDTPVEVLWLTDVKEIVWSKWHYNYCVIKNDWTVWCWWWNENGQIWNWTTSTYESTPKQVSWITDAIDISFWYMHGCAILSWATIKCWWHNAWWNLWDGTTTQRNSPVSVSGSITNAAEISVWLHHSCVRLSDLSVKCWGYDGHDQMRSNGNVTKNELAPLDMWLSNVVEISSSAYTIHVRYLDNSQFAWGYNGHGEVSYTNSVPWSLQLSWWYHHACQMMADGSVYCWWRNIHGECWSSGVRSHIPQTVVKSQWVPLTDVEEIVTWYLNNCARHSDWTITCWWYNDYWQLWRWTTWDNHANTKVSWISNAISLTAWMYHNCARLSDNSIKCWWYWTMWQLGDWTMIDTNTTPRVVISSSGSKLLWVQEVSAWYYNTIARLSDNSLKSWGSNSHGQIWLSAKSESIWVKTTINFDVNNLYPTKSPIATPKPTWTWNAAQDSVSGLFGYLWKITTDSLWNNISNTWELIWDISEFESLSDLSNWTYYLWLKAKDVAWNTTDNFIMSSEVVIDTTPPTNVEVTYINWYNNAITQDINLAATEDSSGIDHFDIYEKQATLTGDTCINYDVNWQLKATTISTIYTNSVENRKCYKYMIIAFNWAWFTGASLDNPSNETKVETIIPSLWFSSSSGSWTSTSITVPTISVTNDIILSYTRTCWMLSWATICDPNEANADNLVPAPTSDGQYYYCAKIRSIAWNWSNNTCTTWTFKLDKTAPIITFNTESKIANYTWLIVNPITSSDISGTVYERTCWIEKWSWATCDSWTGFISDIASPPSVWNYGKYKYCARQYNGAWFWSDNTCTSWEFYYYLQDDSAPFWWSVSYSWWYITNTVTSRLITVDDWTDVASWLDLDTRKLQRSQWTLGWNVCSNYWVFADIDYQGAYPNLTDTWTITQAKCYKYQWIIDDNLWKRATYTNSNEIKIDTSGPNISSVDIPYSPGNIYYDSWIETLFYKSTNLDKNFSIEVITSDNESLINKVNFPNIWTWFVWGWDDTSSLYETSYTIQANTESSISWNQITSYNNAMLTDNWFFNIEADNTPPSGVSITCPSSYDTTWAYTVTWSIWADAWVWLNTPSSYIQRREWILSWNNCSWWNSFTNQWLASSSSLWQSLPIWCYEYRYYSIDIVWNESITDACLIKVDKTNPTISIVGITENSKYLYFNWSNLYYNNIPNFSSDFFIGVSSQDDESWISNIQGSSEFWDSPSDNTSPYSLSYNMGMWETCSDPITISSTNNAWLISSVTINCTLATDPPVNWIVTYTDWYETDTDIEISVNRWTDAISWMSTDNSDYLLEYSKATLSNNICWSYWSWIDTGVNELATATSYNFPSQDWFCYKFRYTVANNVWILATWTSNNETKVSTQTPTISCSISESTNPQYQYVSSNTIYYSSNFSWSFIINTSWSELISWIEKISFPVLWSWFTWWADYLVSTYNQQYDWNWLATTSPWSINVIITANNGKTNLCNLNITNDSNYPSSWSINYLTQYLVRLTKAPSMTISNWSDIWIWIDYSQSSLVRQDWTLSWWLCINYWDYTQTTYSWSIPNIEDTWWISDNKCYQYQFRIIDLVWNETIYSDPEWDVFMVDTTKPIVTIDDISEDINSLYLTWLRNLYYKTISSIRQFTVESYASDPTSLVSKVLFPDLWSWFSTWSNIIYAPSVLNIYENYIYNILSLTSTSPQSNTIEFENWAWLTWNTTFDITVDNTSPIWVSISCPSDYDTDWNYTISGQAWTDAWVWLNTANSFIQKKSWSLEDNVCSWTSSFANIWSAWSNTLWESNLSLWCYSYQYTSEDFVSNTYTTSECSVKVDKTNPISPTYNISENSPYLYYNWSILYYNNTPSSVSNFDLEVITWDQDTLLKSVSGSLWFWDNPILYSGSYNPWSDTGLYILAYSVEQWSTCNNNQLSITSLNNAQLISTNSLTCTEDNDPPINWSISYTNWYKTDTGITINIIDKGIDLLSSMSTDDNDYFLEYTQANLSYDNCWSYTAWTWANVTETVSSTSYNFSSSWWYCYQFRYRVKDKVNNESIWISSNVTKVDTTAPDLWNMQIDESSPYIYYSSSWNIYYNNTTNSNPTFTIQSISWDIQSSINNSEWSLDFWDNPSNNTYPYSLDYTIENWSICSDDVIQISLINKAWLSSNLSIDCVIDTSSPSSWSITYLNWHNDTWIIPITISPWIDLISGMNINDSDYLLEYKRAIYTGGICRTFQSWEDANVNEQVSSTNFNYTAENWYCYMFKYTVKDNVWNESIHTSTNITIVDTTLPTLSISSITENSDYIYLNWNDIYYKNNFADNSAVETLDIKILSSDVESAIVSVSGSEAFWDNPVDYIWEYELSSDTWEYLISYWIDSNSICEWSNITISTINNLWIVVSEDINCTLDNNKPSATLKIVNAKPTNNQVYLNLAFSDGQGESGIDMCRYANEDLEWTSWKQCESSIAWTLVTSAWTRTVYYEVKDKVWNVTNISDTTYSTVITVVWVMDSNLWWWGWWWGWVWWWIWEVSWVWLVPIYTIPTILNKQEIEVTDNVNFEKLEDWIITASIKIQNPSHNYSILINKDTKILNGDWTIFKWIINNGNLYSSQKLPNLEWDIEPIRSIDIWSIDWKSVYFSKPINLTLSTKWISSKIRKSDIQVYSYNEKTKKYDLENKNIRIDSVNDIISVDVSHLTVFVLAYWLELRKSASSISDNVPFKDIYDHWSKTYIEKLYSMWVIKSNENFYPESLLTRVELIKIVLETFWYWTSNDFSNIDFWDIDKTQWYAPYLSKAVEIWIIDGVKKTKVDFDYLKSKFDIKNAQKILKFLWYDIKYTKEYDYQTQKVLIKYQKDRWLKNPLWALWDWTMNKLNNEPYIKKILDDQNWMTLSGFRPQDSVNRAEAMKIIIRASWIELKPWKNQIFPDVRKQDWFSGFVNTAALNSIVSWYSSWLFWPWDKVTRGQITKIAVKTFEYSEVVGE